MSTDHLLITVEDGIARLTFNRPDTRNAASPEMLEALLAFLLRAEQDPTVRCIVLRGAGGQFMAGGDVRSFAVVATMPAHERLQHFESRVSRNAHLFNVMQRLPQPVIACVEGTAAGAGIGFAIAADLTVAARSAAFILAHVNIGASPDASSSWHLPRAVGMKQAMSMALLPEAIGAEAALAHGLISHLAEDSEIGLVTDRLARRLAQGPATALAQAKRLMHQSLGHTLAEQLAAEARSMGLCAASPDFIEGPRAFLEKRRPVFGQA